MKNKLWLAKNAKISKVISAKNSHIFFGFYDVCPWNKNERYLLALQTSTKLTNCIPTKKNKATILLIDTKNETVKKVGETEAWNWQQGCRLQWLPPIYDSHFVYNDRKGNKLVAIIKKINGKKKKLPYPIYSLSPCGRHALTFNFYRWETVRPGYGYSCSQEFESLPKEDGIFLIDLNTHECKLIVSLEKLYNIFHLRSMEDTFHWVEQPVFNSDGSRFCFFHRWKLKDGTTYTRLYTCNLDGSDLYLLGDCGNYTHFTWKSSQELICWGCLSTKLLNIRKTKLLTGTLSKLGLKIYHRLLPNIRRKISNSGYLHFIDKSKKVTKLIEDEDGHCSFSPSGRYLLADTYPDINHYRKLVLYDLEKKKKIVIGKFYSLPSKKYLTDFYKKFGRPLSRLMDWDWTALRCDLHSRWNWRGDKICIDSVHEGVRKMYIIEICNLL